LVQALRDAGISCERRSEEEIWKLVRKRAIDRFTSAVRTFVGRCRKRNLGPDDVTELVAAHTPCSISEESFLEVGTAVYRCYLQRLDDLQKEDFDGLMWRSVRAVRNGQSCFVRDRGRERGDLTTLRYVMIDEFQDFSKMFYELINAIHSINPRVRYFCVGDDWQAINAFAGSDLRFFEDFSQYFSDTSRHHIRTNYRSPKAVVETGNALMVGLGKPARAHRSDTGWVQLCDLKTFKPSEPENAEHNGDNITPALLRIVRALLDHGLEVVMLSRRKGLPWYVNYGDGAVRSSDALKRFLEHVRSYLPEEDRGRVFISTAHGYKGLECAAVVVLDATDRSYPLIHPDWIFLRLFGDSIEHILDEERRLFYVAITRAVDSLAVLTDTSAYPSPFLTDIHNHTPMRSLRWKDLSPVPSLNSPRLEVRVYDAYEVRNQLKDRGYRWDAGAKCWRRAYMAEGFSFNELLGQAWAGYAVRIEVYSEAGKLLHHK
jgi:DNA helicase-4